MSLVITGILCLIVCYLTLCLNHMAKINKSLIEGHNNIVDDMKTLRENLEFLKKGCELVAEAHNNLVEEVQADSENSKVVMALCNMILNNQELTYQGE